MNQLLQGTARRSVALRRYAFQRRTVHRSLSLFSNHTKSSTPRRFSSSSAPQERPTLEEATIETPAHNQQASRRVAAQSVPYWLKTEPYCFERTVSALNLSTDRYQQTSSTTELSDQYRKAFRDSVPSYGDLLKTSDTLPKPVEDALDRLVEAGFGDAEFSKSFRSLKSNELQFAKLTAQLQQKQEKYERRQEILIDIQQVVKELEEELAVLLTKKEELEKKIQKHAPPPTDKASTNALLSFLAAAVNMSGPQAPPMEEKERVKLVKQLRHQQVVLDQKIGRQKSQIQGRTSHIQQHELGSEHAQEAIEELQRQHSKLQASTMTSEVYQATYQVVKEALLVICDSLADHIQERHSNLIEQYQILDERTDLTKPHEWYPWARLDKRKVIYHGGPTNSGKTYNALQRLMQAKRGIYLGPLRLLAAEVYEKLNSQGVYTSLLTGQERREFPFSTHIAATVEMAANLIEEEFDVVVIDEIQMMEDKERGFAWTRALLGIRCKEIHVCGGLEAKPMVERIVEACGDDFELHQYDRFSDLTVARNSLARKEDQTGAYSKVQPGDCVVAFSRTDIFAIKREIEAQTKHKCCVIYGTLPPHIRTAQAQLFNNPDSGFDVLIASDAVSMGLNLNIRRVIFNSIYKNDGSGIVRLGHSAVKQIAGRAGRRNSQFPNGEATCRDPRDLAYIQECMSTEITPIEKAGLIPTGAHVELFGEALQIYHFGFSEPIAPHLHTILKEFSDMAVVRGDFFLCRQDHMHQIAKWMKAIELETKTKFDFCMAPISLGNNKAKQIMVKYAQKLDAGEVPGMMRGSPLKRAKAFNDLGLLCEIYSDVELFIWLQNKFPPINLMERQAAVSKRDSTAALITQALQDAERLRLDHCYVKRDINLRRRWATEQEKPEEDDAEESSEFDERWMAEEEEEEERLRSVYH